MEAKSILGRRLKSLRGKRTQEEVSQALGLSRARYSHYENNRVEPDIEILNKIADFYNVTTDYLLGRTDDPHLLKEDEEFERFKNNPELERWFKQLPENDEEDLQALKDMWEIIKRNKKK